MIVLFLRDILTERLWTIIYNISIFLAILLLKKQEKYETNRQKVQIDIWYFGTDRHSSKNSQSYGTAYT
jgi:hypothetical protein